MLDKAMSGKLRLVTYNIHKGIGGVDRRYQLDRVVDTLRHCQPDIALLQEVDDGVPRSRKDRQVDLLAEALQLPYLAYQQNVSLTLGHYGNAVLSRYPMTSFEDVDLSVPLKKRRRALVVRCRVPVGNNSRSLLVVNVHLGLSSIERQFQLRRLLQRHPLAQVSRRLPVAIGGDYNDVYGNLGRRVMFPQGFASVGQRIRTFPAVMPVRCLDQIFYRGSLELTHAFAGHSRVARQASDHLPLVADFTFIH
jgi:endonuclease/exonuclease/phosphatase family metal-dependent hydrolase